MPELPNTFTLNLADDDEPVMRQPEPARVTSSYGRRRPESTSE